MAGPEQRGSMGVDNRQSTRVSMQEDDDNDFALAAMGISDGFRPTEIVNSHGSQLPPQVDRQPSVSRVPPPRPSSTAKPAYDSFALRHDGGMEPSSSTDTTGRSGSDQTSSVTRASSVSTESPYIRPESPYRGPSGPTHPYQMYPQESRVARTASVATTSTAPMLDRTSYAGPRAPAHPYGMYPQNIVSGESSQQGSVPMIPITAGFPGRNNDYRRRLGPDGEEAAGIIGPDGHTEELPPYTQYPDEAFARKAQPGIHNTALNQLPVLGAGGIGLATRNPEFASTENLFDPPQSRHSARSMMSGSSSHHEVNMAAYPTAEKPPLKKWQIIAHKRICSVIPIWALVLVGTSLVLFGIILGSVLAALKPKHPPPQDHPPNNSNDSPQSQLAVTSVTAVAVSMTTTFDATPLSTLPAHLPSLPTGVYQLPITTPSVAPASCIMPAAENVAWSCQIPMSLPYTMTITDIPSQFELADAEITLNYGNNTVDFLAYGAQPPILDQAKVLRLVNDTEFPERGPAWFFQVPYNKLVILDEDTLSATSSSSKRDSSERDHSERDSPPPHNAGGFLGRKGVAQPGEKPWFCYWNGTLLEAFIYVNETSLAGIQQENRATSTTSSSYSAATVSYQVQSGQSGDPVFLPQYPKVLRMEERRIPVGDNISPYCIQQIVNSDGSHQPYVPSGSSKPVTIYLNETEPTTVTSMGAKRNYLSDFGVRDFPLLNERQSGSQCGCVWLAQ